MSEMKKIESYKTASKNPRLQRSTKSEPRTLNSTLEIKMTATSTSARP